MQTQAYFDDIQLHIIREIKRATSSVHIAVAWFTDPEIFEELCKKLQAGVRVELIIFNDEINRRSPIEYSRLNDIGGMFLMVGDKKRNSAVMHNKFCVIDTNTVITGSYNWSRKAQTNDENVTIITECPELARQFIDEFEALIDRNSCKGAGSVDYLKILQRLEALRYVLPLEDKDDIDLQIKKLKKLLPVEDSAYKEIYKIFGLINDNEYENASAQIAQYVQNRKQVTVYSDPEIAEIRLELNALEIQISSLESEKADINKSLYTFHFRHTTELGEIIRKILRLREALLKSEADIDESKQEEYEDAKNDSAEYEEDYQETIQKEIFTLTKAEEQEQKTIFRACLKMCHPDAVASEYREDATLLCSQLNEANSRNDFNAIKEIFENLNQGIFKPLSDTVGDAQQLLREAVKHRTKVKRLAKEIFDLRTSETYIKVKRISDWDEYFTLMRAQLHAELEALEEDVQGL